MIVERPQITIVLDRLRSAHNAGNIFRLADAVGAKEVLCCGYTPAPPHPKLERTAMGADKTVPCRVFPTALDALRALRSEGPWSLVAVEKVSGAPCAWDFDYKFPLALLFGNEALGVSQDALDECDAVVALPMLGGKTSINVGNCAAVALYAALACARKKGFKLEERAL